MDHNPCLYAQRIVTGVAEVEDGFIRGERAGESQKESVLSVVEVLDEASNSPLCPSPLRKGCLVALPAICATDGILPSRCLLAGHLVVDYQSTICVGGADVRRGTLDGITVTVKTISCYLKGSLDDPQENAYREVIIWKNLKHPNILPLLGVDASILPLTTVSECMEYGNLREYLARFPNASRSNLLLDASRGLEYMHGVDCIHGDLKAFNVHVSSDHSAVLTNFRLASFLPDSEADAGASVSECDPWSVRWLAPELLFPEKFGLESARRSKETDVYAFAMVMYEAFSGSFPFEDLRNESSILCIRSGDRPHRPESGWDFGLTDELWKVMKTCWKRRDRRWKISHVVSTLEHHAVAAVTALAG
ncbi:kinase-like domain-containing protein, partial [Thelephora terrestris]